MKLTQTLLAFSFLFFIGCSINKSVVRNLSTKGQVLKKYNLDKETFIIIQEGKTLRLSCRVHMPKGGKIIVHPDATLILNGCKIHNDCGEVWGGIDVLTKGKKIGVIEYLGRVEIENLESSI